MAAAAVVLLALWPQGTQRGPGAGSVLAAAARQLKAARTLEYTIIIEETPVPNRLRSDLHVSVKLMHKQPLRWRSENGPGADNEVIIVDGVLKKMLTLHRDTNTAVLTDTEDVQDQESQDTEFIAAHDMHEQLLSHLSATYDEYLGEQEIDGRMTAAYRSGGTTIWVALDTGSLFRIEQIRGPFTYVTTDFAFDTPLDGSLFSLEPPPGYTLEVQ
jgi:outer membrane lipoprotein-sorting protein